MSFSQSVIRLTSCSIFVSLEYIACVSVSLFLPLLVHLKLFSRRRCIVRCEAFLTSFFLQFRSSSFFHLKHFRVVQKIKIKTVDDKNHIANNRIGLKLVLWKAQLRNVSLKEKKRPFVVPILPFCLIDNDKLKSFASLVSRRNRSVSVKL